MNIIETYKQAAVSVAGEDTFDDVGYWDRYLAAFTLLFMICWVVGAAAALCVAFWLSPHPTSIIIGALAIPAIIAKLVK